RFILHLFFWVTYCLFAGVISFHLQEGFTYIVDNSAIFLMNGIWAAVVFYVHYNLLYKYIPQTSYLKYLLLSLGIVLVVSTFFYFLIPLVVFTGNLRGEMISFGAPLAGSFIIGNCGSLLRGFTSWVTESGRKDELEKQNLRVELKMLRSQLNNHFLFNTLNNIDALIFRDPQRASDALISLSSILRYMLYQTNGERVSLHNEIENIRHVIYLEQLRVSTPGYTQISIEGNPSAVMVPPLLFVSFVENAYKHSKFNGALPVIHIKFAISDSSVRFTCLNSSDSGPGDSLIKESIGLENIRRRLNLIYGNSCIFEVARSKDEFRVHLEIPC
ncbi:MAG TPA: histidine kinase, partial [Bacteroidales bacterium]|nr:histidine kinase [Bacteroidales bacterium]